MTQLYEHTVLCSYIAEDNAAVIALVVTYLCMGLLVGFCVGMSIRWTQVEGMR